MTLHLPPHLEQRLESLSQQLGKSEQVVLEEMLEEALPKVLPKYRRTSIGMGNSGLGDLSERVDELLFTRTKRGSISEFKKLLARVPKTVPLAGDELKPNK
jgi:hypothetical protein